MTRYVFLIDQDTCIGCHACTTACKAEHDVPLGVNRTWVKYIEKGTFPDSRRMFSVMRCNHCDNAPCVAICPTGALFTRHDGIVDFDTSRCVGCKACMNACPYDALYIDPQEHTAQKCNFCTHRLEVGLEPSCVIVCPTESIIAGDLDDPMSRISQMRARHETRVRAAEQGTRPKLFYKGADEASLDPTRTAIAVDGIIWAETTPAHPSVHVDLELTSGSGQSPGEYREGVIARTVYTTAHPAPWGSAVSAYLVTKSIAGGVLMVAALLVLLGEAHDQAVWLLAPGLAAFLSGHRIRTTLPQRLSGLQSSPQNGSKRLTGASTDLDRIHPREF